MATEENLGAELPIGSSETGIKTGQLPGTLECWADWCEEETESFLAIFSSSSITDCLTMCVLFTVDYERPPT